MIHTNLLHIFCLFVFINPKSPRWYDKWRLYFNFNGAARLLIHYFKTHADWINSAHVYQCVSFCVCMTLHASYTVTMHLVVLFCCTVYVSLLHVHASFLSLNDPWGCAPEHKEVPCFLHRHLSYDTEMGSTYTQTLNQYA